MAIRKNYTITDDEGQAEDVTVSRAPNEDENAEDVITLAAPGADISITLSMAKELVEALNLLLKSHG